MTCVTRFRAIIELISLDGVIQLRSQGEDGDCPYGGWTARYRTPAGRYAILAAHGGDHRNAKRRRA
jgi:hypothetical protein